MNQQTFDDLRGPGTAVLWFGEVLLGDRRNVRIPGKVLQDAGERPFLVLLEPGARIRRVRTRMPPEWFAPAIPGEVYSRLVWS